MVSARSEIILPSTLRMVAWEITRRCNLSCLHCRASSEYGPYEGEFNTERCFELIDDIAEFSNPVIILTGGEPYLRKDIFEIAAYGDRKGLRMVLATNGTLVTDEIAGKTRGSGIKRVSISIDGSTPERHDSFRGVPGAFEGSMTGIEAFKRAGVEFQINTTITRLNLDQVEDIMNLSIALGAVAHHIFLLVPTGRAKDMADQEISPEDYEKTLHWFYEQNFTCPIQLKATCAPQYYRIFHQRKKEQKAHMKDEKGPFHAMTRGCMGGSSFCFISHTGQIQPCGFLEIDCGQLNDQNFRDIWNNSPVFNDLRNLSRYKGKCGRCEFIKVCGGCRARAYEISGDYLAEEPFCIYRPKNSVQ
ncbi:MAG: heme b synthase [Deltaproteobacteria bacterium]|nr:heme b synthase [Deltaproteobacteria bacterium]